MSDFYVGYLPKAPAKLGRLLRAVSALLLFTAAGSAVTITMLQNPFAASAFEFGKPRGFEGVIEADPYPALLVQRPGQANGTVSRYLLVAEGKHGAASQAIAFDGKSVNLKGTLIFRDNQTMIEVVTDSITSASASGQSHVTVADLGPFDLTGEIVDSKCYLGVMNPANGKVHHDCAVRCLSGGIPPIFAVNDFRGVAATFVLADSNRKALPREALLKVVARRVHIHGRVSRVGDTLLLEAEPSAISPVS
jgi:hypothetical protein